MDPLTLSLLMNVGGGLLGGLAQRPQEIARKRWQQHLMSLLSQGNLFNTTGQFYNQFLGSPAYVQAQHGAFQRGNMLQGGIANALAQRGLGQSGLGAIAGPLGQSAAAGMLGNVRTGAYNNALQAAQANIQQQVGLQ